ncbi:hypothetical protein ACHAWC_003251 [Mediolabrus comicus]
MNLLQYQRPNNPLKLLDDYLSSISSSTSTNDIRGETADFCANDNDDSDAIINDATAVADATTTASSSSPEKQSTQIAQEQEQQQQQQQEHLHNSVLRAASELFGKNISLLENSLALLEEQEQYQNNDSNDGNNVVITIPPIRTIRARRSGRVAVLVQKQKKKSRSSQSGNDKHSTDDYYLCLLGRDKFTIDSTHSAIRTSQGTYLCTPQHRIGMHCTCRSFFHNVKGDSGRYKSNDERSPSRSNSNNNSNNSNKSNIVCKHLLAVILMPHLLPWRKDGVEEDIVDDKMFAKLVMKASIG